ncbi:MAG: hypothetical protein KDB14_09685 [Planctomycetales bacterium]|nr:hypothetical protein [Planctomycetales bacterium]
MAARRQQRSSGGASRTAGMSQQHTRANRRGVVLLVILSLLALFVVVGLTFTLVASIYRNSAETMARSADREDDWQDELRRVGYLLLRDSTRLTALRGHSLMEDIHGGNPLSSTVSGIQQQAGGELYEIQLALSAVGINDNKLSSCVMTVISGRAKNRSYRVVNSWRDASNQLRLLVTPTGRFGSYVRQIGTTIDSYHPQQGDRIIVNRRPYSGTGAGFALGATTALSDVGNGPLDVWLDSKVVTARGGAPHSGSFADVEHLRGIPAYLALMPNYSAYSGNRFGTGGGLNEDWDVADFQNMFLGWLPPVATAADEILPSFHRPELVRYWFHWVRSNIFGVEANSLTIGQQWEIFDRPDLNHLGLWGSAVDRDFLIQLKRRIIMRPLAEDHPEFAKTNPRFTLAGLGAGFTPASSLPRPAVPARNQQFCYDVDNKNDGIPDSIWIDPQFPLKRTPDGRLYKTLFASLIIDLDNRIHLGAVDGLDPPLPAANVVAGIAPPARFGLTDDRYGSGLGPAEIDINNIIANRLGLLTGRYGADGQPGSPLDDLLSYFDHRGLSYGGFDRPGTLYHSVPDLFGRRRTSVDVAGHPIVQDAPMDIQDAVNDPYEARMLSPDAYDSVYTAADMEGLLRANDHDERMHSKRILSQITNPAQQASVTTLSADVPIPASTSFALLDSINRQLNSTLGPGNELNPNASYVTIADLFRAKLAAGGVPAANIDTNLNIIVAPELMRGEPMDANRPFGNLVDDNGNFVVDEYLEFVGGGGLAYPPPSGPVADTARVGTDYGTVTSNLRNDDPLSPANTPQRIFARHLFCLALLMADDFDIPFNSITGRNSPGMFGNRTINSLTNLTAQERELTVQRIAQWAANVADFRDPDSSMTVFEYDANPWDGWNVDGNPATVEGAAAVGSVPADPNSQRRVTIGLEAPELRLTEASGLHDVKERDTDKDESGESTTSMPNPDTDDDQFRPPLGSLFFELMCVRAPGNRLPSIASGNHTGNFAAYNVETPSRELYEVSPINEFVLNVGKLSPARSDMAYPVWRIAITHHHNNGPTSSTYPRVYDREYSHESRLVNDYFVDAAQTNYGAEFSSVNGGTYFDGRYAALPGQRANEVPFERFVWLTPGLSPAASASQEIRTGTFSNLRGGNFRVPQGIGLLPGEYLVIGPRDNTPVGSVQPTPGDSTTEGPSPQQYVIAGNAFSATDLASNQTGPPGRPNARAAVGVVAERLRQQSLDPTDRTNTMIVPWTNTATQYAGLSITEPLADSAGLERLPQPNPGNDPGVVPPDAYMDLYGGATTAYPNGPGQSDVRTDAPFRSAAARASVDLLREYNMENLGTYENVRTAHLQRLADPLLPWNPLPPSSNFDPNLPVNPYVTVDWISVDCTVFNGEKSVSSSVNYSFETGQKGVSAGHPVMTSPWWPQTLGLQQTTAQAISGPGSAFMKHNLKHTLGFLNQFNIDVDNGIAYRRPADTSYGTIDPYQGYPIYPLGVTPPNVGEVFPWIKINNRPYASAYEMMQVPCVGPARLGQEFSVRTGLSGPTALQFMDRTNTNDHLRPYSHLFNFHLGSDVFEDTTVPTSKSLNLFRIFDFVHTPSRFVDTKKWLNPTGTDTAVAFTPFPLGLRPPYNRLLEFREPGKINLNTLYLTDATNTQSHAWRAIMNRFAEWRGAPNLGAMLISRQGFATTFVDQDMPYLPTRFANPFRSAMAARHMPPITSFGVSLMQSEVDASMFRRVPDASYPPATPEQTPLFHVGNPGNRDVNRHAAFAYEGIQRLDNLVTHRSNVYAMWVTVGYFEVEKNPLGVNPALNGVDSGHPDGYRLLRELGSDTGEIKRHRAFYIIDRSIPVGYQAGQNHNVDDAILLQRIIE